MQPLEDRLTPTLSFASAVALGTGAYPQSVAAGDFDGDGRIDLATANDNVAGTVSVLLNVTAGSGTPTFAAQQAFAAGRNSQSVAAGDFDGDGRIDLAVANYGADTVSVLRNVTAAGAATPAFAAQQAFAVGVNPPSVAVGDFNGDGRPDLATANYGTGTVSVLLNVTAAGSGTPSFAAAQTFAVGRRPFSVAVGDFDGDGRIDLATANYNAAGTVSVLRNVTAPASGTPAFAAQQALGTGAYPQSVAAGDFDGDGRIDLATANDNSAGTVSVLRNASTDVLVTGPVTVGQFGTTGVWAFHRVSGVWNQLTGANADALAAAPNGNVVASFGGNGVWYYTPQTNWRQINGYPARAVAIDAVGNAYASFPGFGTATYRLATGSWTTTTGAVADKLAASANSDLVADFAGFGVYRYRYTTNWVQINGFNAVALAVGANGDIAASFAGYGTYSYKPTTGWQFINGVAATSVAVGANGAVAAGFGTFGVAKYIPFANGWQSLHTGTQPPSLAVDAFGNVFATLSGFGVFEFRPAFGWVRRRNTDAGILKLG